jgi:hypothetical protein
VGPLSEGLRLASLSVHHGFVANPMLASTSVYTHVLYVQLLAYLQDILYFLNPIGHDLRNVQETLLPPHKLHYGAGFFEDFDAGRIDFAHFWLGDDFVNLRSGLVQSLFVLSIDDNDPFMANLLNSDGRACGTLNFLDHLPPCPNHSPNILRRNSKSVNAGG